MNFIDRLEETVETGTQLFGKVSEPLLQKSNNLMDKLESVFTTENVIIYAIVLAVIIVMYCVYKFYLNKTDKFSENSKDDKASDKDSKESKEEGECKNENIIFIHRDDCQYSKKMYEIVEKNDFKMGKCNITVLDITSPEGSVVAKKFSILGTPGFVNTTNNKTSMGLKSINEHYSDLKDSKTEEVKDEEKKSVETKDNHKNIVLIGNDNCPFCVKKKDLLDKKLGSGTYTFVESNSPEGTKHMEEKNANGVPLTINTDNDKYVIGFNENVLEELN